jgi:putative flippase GtrA
VILYLVVGVIGTLASLILLIFHVQIGKSIKRYQSTVYGRERSEQWAKRVGLLIGIGFLLMGLLNLAIHFEVLLLF